MAAPASGETDKTGWINVTARETTNITDIYKQIFAGKPVLFCCLIRLWSKNRRSHGIWQQYRSVANATGNRPGAVARF